MSDRAIVSGALRVGIFVLAAKAMVAMRDMAIAWRFGSGPVADAYNVATAIGTWLPLFLAGAIGATIVPALIRASKSNSTDEPARFAAELTGHAMVVAAAVTGVGLGLAAIAPGVFEPGTPAMEAGLSGLLIAFAPFAGLTTLFYFLANRLQALGSFSYSIFEGLPALLVALTIIALASRAGITALAAATVLGGLMQVLLLSLILRRKPGARLRPQLKRRSAEWNGVLAGIGVMTLGQASLSLVLPLDQFFALRLGEGVPSTFGYASRILGLATSMGTLVLGRALLPILAEALHRDSHAAHATALRWAAITFGLGVSVLMIGWPLAEPITRVIFERGTFNANDTQSVARLIRLGLWQLPFYLSGVAAVQWLAVCGRYGQIAAICGVTVIAKIVALALLLPRFGPDALMISTTVMYAVAWLCQLAVLRPKATQGHSSAAS